MIQLKRKERIKKIGRLIEDLAELKEKRAFNEISEQTYLEMTRSKIRKINAMTTNLITDYQQ